VVDELDKVEDLDAKLDQLLTPLKHITADKAFFCFITDRTYFDVIEGTDRSAPDHKRKTFFGDRMRVPPRVIEGARVGPLLRESLSCPPIEVNGDQMFWLFAVRENMQAVERNVQGAMPYLIVASPHLRYQADSRFDVSYWDYANFV